jgi:RHS repeat-associated protein
VGAASLSILAGTGIIVTTASVVSSAGPAAATTPSYSADVLADFPAAYWRLGDSIGAGNLADSSGNGHSMSYSSVTLGRPGGVYGDSNTAAGLTASSSSAHATWSFSPSSFSAQVWFRSVTTPSTMRYLLSAYGSHYDVELGVTSSGTAIAGVKTSAGMQTKSGQYLLTDGAWHQLVMTYDGSTLKLYVDGALDSSLGVAGPVTWESPMTWALGQPAGCGSCTITGDVDEASVFPSVLSSTDVSTQHAAAAAPATPSCTGTDAYSNLICSQHPVGYWRLGESSNTQPAADVTGLGNNGVYTHDTGYSSPTVGAPGGINEPNTSIQVPGRGSRMQVPYDPYGHYASPVGSLAAWVQPSPTSRGQTALVDDGCCGRMALQVWGNLASPTLYYAQAQVTIGTTTYTLAGVSNSGLLAVGSTPEQTWWSYVVVTYDGSTIRLWVNGVDVVDLAETGRLAPCVGCTLEVGEPSNCSGCAGPDTVDEVALYNQALTGAQIRGAFNLVGPTNAELRGGGDLSSDYKPCLCVDPVDTATGTLVESATDASIPSIGPGLDFTRTYDSSQAAVNGPLGYGWRDNYEMTVVTGTNTAVVTQENGSQITFTQDASGNYLAPSRSQLQLTHNGDGTWTLVRRRQLTFTFNSTGFLTGEHDLNGEGITLAYTGTPALNTLSTVTDTAGRTLTFGYSSGRIYSVTDPAGRGWVYAYDASGNLDLVSQPEGVGLSPGGAGDAYGYNGSHDLTSITDASGHETTDTYDGQNRVTEQTIGAESPWQFDYSVPNQTTITDPDGNVTRQVYDQNLLISSTRGYGTSAAQTTTYAYDPTSLGTTSVTVNGHTSSATYDSDGNKLSDTDARGNTESWTYNSLDEQVTFTDRNNHQTTYSYDSTGDLTSVAVPVDATHTATTHYHYDNATYPSAVTSVVDPRSKTTVYGYDSYGELTSTTDPDTNETTQSYGCTGSGCYPHVGLVYSSVSPSGNVSGGHPADYTTTYAYNPMGQLTSTTAPGVSSPASTDYYPNGQVETTTDADGVTTDYSYYGDNTTHQVTTHDGSSSHTVTYNNDSAGLVLTRVDPVETTLYSYDPLNRVASQTLADASIPSKDITTTFTYDGDGNVATAVRPAPGGSGTQTTTYGYYPNHLLHTLSYSDGTTPGVTYGYDPNGNRTSMVDGSGETDYVYNQANWVTSVEDGAHDTVSYDYNLDGEPVSIGYPNGHTVSRGYDDAGLLSSVTDWNTNQTTFGYTPEGQVTTITYPNGVTEKDLYNPAGALTELTDATGASTLADYSYTPSDAGRVTAVTATGSNPGPNETYQYNGYGQLDRYATGGGSLNTVGYNSAGQLTGMPDGTSLDYTSAGELSDLNSGATTFSFDADGNRTQTAVSGGATQTYSYDQANRLTSYTDGTTTASYAYNGDGQRTAKTADSTTTNFTWDPASGSLPLLASDGTTSYLYGPGDLPIEQTNTSGTQTSYLLHDQTGSTRLLTDPSGTVAGTYTYNPYGQVTNHTGASTPLHYDGQYQDDETGLYYMRARYYDPSTAQFLTRDPLEDITGQPYSYAGDDPIDNGDPSGDFCIGNYCLGFHPGTIPNSIVNLGRGFSFGLSDKIANWISPGASCTVGQNTAQQLVGNAATVVATLGWGTAADAAGAAPDLENLSPKIIRQMEGRGWTQEQIQEAYGSGQRVNAINKANGNPATRYINPSTGQSVVVDDVTGKVIHVGGPGFLYGPGSGDLP